MRVVRVQGATAPVSTVRANPRRAVSHCAGRPRAGRAVVILIVVSPESVEPVPAVPAVPRRPPALARARRALVVDGYVSLRGDSVVGAGSTAIQRWQIAAWAAAQGWRVGQIFEEPSTEGSPASAARLREALERVESGESDGIVAVRLTQFGASLREALRAIERIEAAGGTFVSLGDGIDLSTPTGRLILRLLLSVAEW